MGSSKAQTTAPTTVKTNEKTNMLRKLAEFDNVRQINTRGVQATMLEATFRGRAVILKKFTCNGDDGISHRALREMGLHTNLPRHPHILPIMCMVCDDKENALYLAMKRMPTTLSSEMRSFDSISDILGIIRQILEGVVFLHEHKIMHRDIKPDNILWKDRHIFLIDFGLAKQKRSKGSQHWTTRVVTSTYRAPELHLGAQDYDERIDVWSVGIILLELLNQI